VAALPINWSAAKTLFHEGILATRQTGIKRTRSVGSGSNLSIDDKAKSLMGGVQCQSISFTDPTLQRA
jgi:hypothetical protein